MKRLISLVLVLLIAASLPMSAFAVGKPKGSYESKVFKKTETVTFSMKCFNGFTVKSGVTITLSKNSGFEIAGDLVVEEGAKLLGQEGKGEFTIGTGPETTITGMDLYYYHQSNGKVQTLKWPCSFSYAKTSVPRIKEMFDQKNEPKFKWDGKVNGWVMTTVLNGNPFNDPALYYHQENSRNLALQTAGKLNTLGLFAGVGTNKDGSIDYDLWRCGNRVEAVVLLVKLLGLNDELIAKNELVKAGQAEWNCPFVDVKSSKSYGWAIPYIAFAYEKGLTSGKSATEFGLGQVSFQQYCCFLLNALGYTNEDFPGSNIWAGCVEKCKELGISEIGTPDNICPVDAYFWRADMVLMSFLALKCDVQHAEQGRIALYEQLVSSGAFTLEQYRSVE